jgi:hypothetical protein
MLHSLSVGARPTASLLFWELEAADPGAAVATGTTLLLRETTAGIRSLNCRVVFENRGAVDTVLVSRQLDHAAFHPLLSKYN